MRLLLPVLSLGLVLPVVLVGCGETISCPNACERAFREDQCAFGLGLVGDRAQRDCEQECELALRRNGELGNYNPDDPSSVNRSKSFTLQNEAQAAAWMECVAQTSCEDINDGFCPGGGIN